MVKKTGRSEENATGRLQEGAAGWVLEQAGSMMEVEAGRTKGAAELWLGLNLQWF